MQLITIDFETYYSQDYSLSKLTTEEYIRDDRFEVIGVSVKVGGLHPMWFTGAFDATKKFLSQFDWANSMVLAHNTSFDGAILNWRFDIKPRVLADTMSMANGCGNGAGSVSLAALAERYSVGKKGNEVINAKGKRRSDFQPDELAKYGEYCINDVELCRDIFDIMISEGFPKDELKLIDMTLRMFTEPVFELDQLLLEDHLNKTIERKEALLASIEEYGVSKDELMSNPKFAHVLEIIGVSPPMKISKTTGKETFAFAKTDDGFKELLSHPSLAVQTLAAARAGTKSTIEETRTKRFIAVAGRGLLPVPIKYSGAKTKRWSGEGGGINMQNLPRKSKLKQSIRAPQGYTMVGVDLSNIELRIGLWFGGMHDKLLALACGVDLYKDFAAKVFGVDYALVTSDQRFIGKTSQLSLIYGVGAKKLRQAIIEGSELYLKKRIDIGEAEAKRIVAFYRREYHGVVKAWDMGEKVLRAIHDDQYMEYGPNGVIKVHGEEGLLLPCGLYMAYPDLHRRTKDDGNSGWAYKGKYSIWEDTYGAKTFQGVIQALARCQMGDGMLRVKKHFPVALTVHDAIYGCVPKLLGEGMMEVAIEELCVRPVWAPDLPLAANGAFGDTMKDATPP